MAVGLTPRGKEVLFSALLPGVHPDRRETILRVFWHLDWLKVSMKVEG